jgi:hypothetical protein
MQMLPIFVAILYSGKFRIWKLLPSPPPFFRDLLIPLYLYRRLAYPVYLVTPSLAF